VAPERIDLAKKYWLFKSEPGCFSIDDLAEEKDYVAHWDGVRNYQARNMLRDEIKKGDGVLFYHSGANPPGIAGSCVVVKSGYPDHTAWDPNSEHPDPKSTPENPIWYMVDIKLKDKARNILPLPLLKQVVGLEEMVVNQRGSRLSIQPVRPDEWRIIMGLLQGMK
jgi:predicted RNA-binding protein with PUA-like domain